MSEYNPRFLDLYTDYLITSFGQATATGMSQVLEGEVSHDQVTRMLTNSHLGNKAIWKAVKNQIRKIESSDGVLIIDDSVGAKPYMDENSIVTYHYDHSQGKIIKGINFMSCRYETNWEGESVCLPLQVEVIAKTEPYLDKKSGKIRYRSKKTKNEIFKEMLLQIKKNQIKYTYIVADVWFSSVDNMKFIHQNLEKKFVIPIKSNRKIRLLEEEEKFSVENQGSKTFRPVESLELKEDTAFRAEIVGIPFEVRLIKHIYRNKDGTGATVFLITNDLEVSEEDMFKTYQRRWAIEPYHKSLKQNASLMKSPAKTKWTQRNHVIASILGYIKLEGLKISIKVNHFALVFRIYIKATQASRAELIKIREGCGLKTILEI